MGSKLNFLRNKARDDSTGKHSLYFRPVFSLIVTS